MEKVKVYIFWNPGCHHCTQEKVFMKELESEYTWLKVHYLNIKANPEYRELYMKVVASYGKYPVGFPATLIGNDLILGYDGDIGTGVKIQRAIMECREKGCIDPIADINMLKRAKEHRADKYDTAVLLPVFGKIDSSRMSLPLFTILIGGIDGFNPCAFFVLFFLLSLLIHAQSRRRMFLIGGVFVFFSGFIYFLFMAAWLNLFLIVGQLEPITYAAGIIALLIASLNIKDFFLFKKGVSLTIPESAKPRLFKRMRDLVKVTHIPSMILGTIILATASNTYELLCTAGFPMVYTRVLTLHELSSKGYYGYLALYNFVYVLPLFSIVLVFTLTLGSWKLKERTGRMLKLLSGFMMLSLGLVLITLPDLLNDLRIAIGIIVFAICATVITNLLMKHVIKTNTVRADRIKINKS
jgi:hypothetical protein